ncbi:MAG: pyridoxal phosphate-dependent decarboxylase family protein [Geminicoccaceae bacterium]
MKDRAFEPDIEGLKWALEALLKAEGGSPDGDLPEALPVQGLGEMATLEILAPMVLGGACHLGEADAFAHMDPPTPWITWATTMWNASLNQNLLHPDLSPAARRIEALVIDWVAPFFEMDGGHMTSGSTLANLTALWAARELRSIEIVIASEAAHLSIAKAAHLLGLGYHAVKTDDQGRMAATAVEAAANVGADLSKAALVLTAGTTSAGAIDDLALTGLAAWTHVDAAWAGPMVFSDRHRQRLDGMGKADSIAVSAHKWLFQPKESAMILFKDVRAAHPAISFGGAYLATPNVGVQGSHGAIAVPLLATLLAWGQGGLAERIDRAMDCAEDLWQRLNVHPKASVFGPHASGVILWRPTGSIKADQCLQALPSGSTSQTMINGEIWLRNVAANPSVDIGGLWAFIERLLDPG